LGTAGTSTPTSTSGGRSPNATGGQNIKVKTKIALGYSLFMRDANTGRAIRVDPSRTFFTGERVRLNLEPNINGYLYVFYRENDGSPTMLFPDARLNGGDNSVKAHVPYEVPSSKEADESKRWFVFKDNPSTENLYIIVTREPLSGVPRGNALKKDCTEDPKKCSAPVSDATWAMVKKGLKESVVTYKSKSYGKEQTQNESNAVERGLGLMADDPAPSIVRMSAVSKSKTLVTAIALVHKGPKG
jgi:hypothetical protein